MIKHSEEADKLARNAVTHLFIMGEDSTYNKEEQLYTEEGKYKPHVQKRYREFYEYFYDKLLNDSI